MAHGSTVFKAELQISDIDRGYYESHSLTVARHPSETDERLMVRLLAFACHASENLAFASKLAEAQEPDLWQKDLTGAIQLWIEVGQPDEKRLLKACGRSDQVVVYAYASNAASWWKQASGRLEKAKNLTVLAVAPATVKELAALAQRNLSLSFLRQEGQIWLTVEDQTVTIELLAL